MIKIKQLPLVAAIATEISNQQPGSTISQDQLNIIITAANRICAAFEQPERDLCDNCNDWPRGGCQPGCVVYK